MSERVTVFDTTLRDGEQAAGVCFSVRDKLEIARRLEAMRVDVIEAGFPAASAAETEAVACVAREVREATICGMALPGESFGRAFEDFQRLANDVREVGDDALRALCRAAQEREPGSPGGVARVRRRAVR